MEAAPMILAAGAAVLLESALAGSELAMSGPQLGMASLCPSQSKAAAPALGSSSDRIDSFAVRRAHAQRLDEYLSFYLSYCEAGFRSRSTDVLQVEMSHA